MKHITDTRTKRRCKWHLCDSDVIVQSSSSSSSRSSVSSFWSEHKITVFTKLKGHHCLILFELSLLLNSWLFFVSLLQVFVGSEAHKWLVLTRYIHKQHVHGSFKLADCVTTGGHAFELQN
jgi:hypothetical protein